MATQWSDLYSLASFQQYIPVYRLTQAEKVILFTPSGDHPQTHQNGELLLVASLNPSKISRIAALHLHDGGPSPRQSIEAP